MPEVKRTPSGVSSDTSEANNSLTSGAFLLFQCSSIIRRTTVLFTSDIVGLLLRSTEIAPATGISPCSACEPPSLTLGSGTCAAPILPLAGRGCNDAKCGWLSLELCREQNYRILNCLNKGHTRVRRIAPPARPRVGRRASARHVPAAVMIFF